MAAGAQFDPDAFMAQRQQPQQATAFDPDTFMAQRKTPGGGAQPPQQEPWYKTAYRYSGLEGLADLATGAIKGAGETAHGLADVVTGGNYSKWTGGPGQAFTPNGPIQQAGKMAERIGEYAAPVGMAGNAARGVLAGAPTAARILGTAAAEGATAGGVAGLQTGGDPTAMRDAALATGGTSALIGAAGAAAPWLKDSAVRQYQRVLGPTTRENKILAQRVTPELLDRGVMAATRKGLSSKIGTQVQAAGQAIEDAIANLPQDAAIPADKVYSALNNAARTQFTIPAPAGSIGPQAIPPSPEAARSLDVMGGLKELLTLGERVDANGNPVIDARYLRELRQSWDKLVAKGGGFTTNDLVNNAKLAAYRAASGSLREQFAQQFPDVDAVNKEYALWRSSQKIIDATLQRTAGQSKPLGEQIAQNAGMVLGGTHGGIEGAALGRIAGGRLVQLMRSPAWGTVSAVVKNNLADALASGNTKAAEAILGGIAGSAATQSAYQPGQTVRHKNGQLYKINVVRPDGSYDADPLR